MREPPRITEERLRACLQDRYGLTPVTLDFLPLGLDDNAGVYRVVSEQGTPYLLKVKSGLFYEPSCLVPGYLRDQGVTSVVAPLPTKSDELWVGLDDWTAALYPFIDGDASLTGMTNEQWKETGAIFKRIHRAAPPCEFESLRKETCDPTEYVRWVREFETGSLNVEDGAGSPTRLALRSCWIAHQPTIHTVVTSLAKLAGPLQRQTLPHIICHANLHPANLLRDRAGRVFVIDWDDVMLAPKERDFLFIEEAPAEGSAAPGWPPFFEGYGQPEIDWIALTYFRYERVVQDLIACARRVFFRDDLGEESKAEAVHLFREIVAEGGMIGAARRAAAHLPQNLS